APNLLTSLLGSRVRLPDVIPIAVTGSLDDPIVRMQTGQAAPVEGAAPAAPAPATPEGTARQLLDQVLGGSQQRQTPPPAEAPVEQQKPQQQQPTKPEDILRGILRGLPQR
ncbi:MAG: hypothetical protein WCZ23_15955, partial [Rhodospirillaceae bacterium]